MVCVHPTVAGGQSGVLMPMTTGRGSVLAVGLMRVLVSLVLNWGTFWRLKLELQAALSLVIALMKVTLRGP